MGLRSMTRWLILTVILLTLGVTTPAAAEGWIDCGRHTNPDLAVRACTDLIISGKAEGGNLPFAYQKRGIAYDARMATMTAQLPTSKRPSS